VKTVTSTSISFVKEVAEIEVVCVNLSAIEKWFFEV
jgi:hypothetical protein